MAAMLHVLAALGSSPAQMHITSDAGTLYAAPAFNTSDRTPLRIKGANWMGLQKRGCLTTSTADFDAHVAFLAAHDPQKEEEKAASYRVAGSPRPSDEGSEGMRI